MSAPLPPADLVSRPPILLDLPADTDLHRFYRTIYEPIYFDPSSNGRFNAPDASYGVLYAAQTISGAFAETFMREPGRTLLSADFIAARGYVRLRNTRPLRLVRFAGPGLGRLGATAEVVHGGLPYAVPQAWSVALHGHRAAVDGIAYRGRHNDDEFCYAFFDRARNAIREIVRDPSLDADWFWQIAEPYGVGLSPA